MADGILFLGWNRPVIGREQQALELFTKSMEFYGKLQSDGRIDSFDTVILEAHGGDLNGFIMLKGDPEKLSELKRDETFMDLSTEAGFCIEGFGIVEGVTGERLTDAITRWSKLIGG